MIALSIAIDSQSLKWDKNQVALNPPREFR